MKLFSIFFLLLIGAQAGADIIFLDLNNNPQEIEAAKRAARKRGENLLVYPQLDKNEAALVESYRQRMGQLERQYHSVTGNNADTERDRIATEYRRLEDERRQKVRDTSFNPPDLEKVLGELAAKKAKVSSIVISGHDGNNDFMGSQGHMDAGSLSAAFQKHPELADGIESLFLAGCYTVKPGTLEYQFKGTFKNLKAIAGYDASAPAGDKPAGHQYIENFLKGEKKLADQSTEKGVRGQVRSIIPSALTTNASMCLPGNIYVERDKYMDMGKAWEKCDELAAKLEKGNEMYSCYSGGGEEEIYEISRPRRRPARPQVGGEDEYVDENSMEAGQREEHEGQTQPARNCDNPPADTHNSELRDYYNVLQEIAPCKHKPDFSMRDGADPERVIRLIYYKKVASAFASTYRDELKDSKQILIDAGMSPEEADKITKLSEMSRKEALAFINKVEQIGYMSERMTGDVKKDKAVIAAQHIAQGLKSHLAELSPRCVPFDWVDAGNRASACGKRTYLGAQAIARADKSYEKVKVHAELKRLQRERDNLTSGSNYYGRGSSSLNNEGENGVDPDPVVSDQAAEQSALRPNMRGYDVRIRALNAEYQALEYQQELDNMEADDRMRPSYEREIQSARERAAQARQEVERLGPAVNLETMRRDRRAFFRAALAGAQQMEDGDSRAMRENLEHERREVQRYRDAMQSLPADSPMRRSYERAIRDQERIVSHYETYNRQRDQHVEYLREMSNLLDSEGPNPEAQARISAIVQSRVQAMRDERIASLNETINHYQRQLDECSRQPEWCGGSNRIDRIRRQMESQQRSLREAQVIDDTM